MNDPQRHFFYDMQEVSEACRSSFWWGIFTGVGSSLIVGGFVLAWWMQ